MSATIDSSLAFALSPHSPQLSYSHYLSEDRQGAASWDSWTFSTSTASPGSDSSPIPLLCASPPASDASHSPASGDYPLPAPLSPQVSWGAEADELSEPLASSTPGDAASSHSRPFSSSPSLDPPSHAHFLSRKVACQVCHYAKVRCEGGRPCLRCIRVSKEAFCSDRPSRRADKRRHRQSEQQQQTKRVLTGGRESSSGQEEQFGTVSLQRSPRRRRTSPPLLRPQPRPSLWMSHGRFVDDGRLSSVFLTEHLRWLSQHSAMSRASHSKQTHLREKIELCMWFDQLLGPADRAVLYHAVVPPASWWADYFDCHQQRLLATAANLLVDIDSASLVSSFGGSSSSTELDSLPAHDDSGSCDGRVCSGFCPFLRALRLRTPSCLSWERTPQLAMPDQHDMPNHAFIALRRLRDQSITCKQEALVDEVCVQLATETLAARRATRASLQPHGMLPSAQSLPSLLNHPAAPVSLLEVAMTVHSNAAFERLLGYSQSELRQLFISQGERAFYGLFAEEDWPLLMALDKQVRWGRRDDFRIAVTALDRRHERLSCLLHGTAQYDREGKWLVTYLSFIPLPDTQSGP